jgi:RNA polymerase sigma factor (sigma-70 family)
MGGNQMAIGWPSLSFEPKDAEGAGGSPMSLDGNHQKGLGDEICEVLAGLRDVHSLKRLFWELLGYDRRDESVLISNASAFRSSVAEARLLASHESFHIYHVTLSDELLTRPFIHQVCRSIRSKHRYVAVLFSDLSQSRWLLAYVTEDPTIRRPRARLATISLGHSEENLRRQANRLARLKTYDSEDEPVGQLELIAAYDEVFTAIQPRTKRDERNLEDLAQLLQSIGRYPLLTAGQERAIFVELGQISDTLDIGEGNRRSIVRVPDPDFADRYEELREQLVLHNQRLCFLYAKKYSRTQEDLFDLFQEAVIGLLRAIEMFDVGRNLKFSTYAVHWIKQRIRSYASDHRSVVRLPRHARNLPEHERPRLSIEPLEGADDGQPRDFEDESSHAPSFKMEQNDRVHLIGEILHGLRARDRAIVSERFGLNGSRPKTLEEIGRELKLTKERIRQIEGRALGRIRDHLAMLGQDKI